MEENKETKVASAQPTERKHSANLKKVGLMVLISLLLLILLAFVGGIISEREDTKHKVEQEIAESYADAQCVGGGMVYSTIVTKKATDSCAAQTETVATRPSLLHYQATVETDVLHRSIYDVIVYNSTIEITGKIPVCTSIITSTENMMGLEIKDFKGLVSMPYVTVGERQFAFERIKDKLMAKVEFPAETEEGDEIDFSISLKVKGTESIMFYPLAERTTASITSSYPHPSFQGDFLPESREVREDGFNATWNVLRMNTYSDYEEMNTYYDYDEMGVKFVDPANPYQQAMRSAKYGMLIVFLTFVASMLVEYLTRKEINLIQYGVICVGLQR